MVSKNDPFTAFIYMWDYMAAKQEEAKEFKKILSVKGWLKEYCTLKFGLCRQAGHSSIIKSFVGKKSTTVCFCFNHSMGRQIYRGNYLTFAQIGKDPQAYRKQFVFVDNHSFMTKKQEEKLYDTLDENTQLITLMQ